MFGLFEMLDDAFFDGDIKKGCNDAATGLVTLAAIPVVGLASLAGVTLGLSMIPLAVGGLLLADGFDLHLFGCNHKAPLIQQKTTQRRNWSDYQFKVGALRAETALRKGVPHQVVFAEIRKHYKMPPGACPEGVIKSLNSFGCTHLVHYIRQGS